MTVKFESAELLYKQILEEFFVSVCDEKSLASHGIDHHRRVWQNARELVLLLEKYNHLTDPEIIFKLIIACYLHDIGMFVDPGIRHGIHSRDLCIRFLNENSLPVSEYEDVLDAVENHDNKEYTTAGSKSGLLTILSVADDLDAFGFLGIYRYSEIYLTRGIDAKELGNMIRENAAKRFNHFVNIFGFDKVFVLKHKKRYEILDNFFSEYNKQAETYKFSGQPSGYCGVIELLDRTIYKKRVLNDFKILMKKYSNDRVIAWYFSELELELKI